MKSDLALYNTIMNENDDSQQPYRILLRSLTQAGQMVSNELDKALSRFGLSIAKIAVLKVLVEAEHPLPLEQMAGRLSLVQSNITQLVDQLEAGGLITRVSDPDDRSSIRAVITEKGQRQYSVGLAEEAKVESELFGQLSANEREYLLGLLQKVLSSRRRRV